MSQVFHPIEKQIIKSLKESKSSTPEKLVESTKLSIDQVRRGMEWLKLKGLADIQEIEKTFLRLGKNGLDAKNNGLPERKLVNEIQEGPKSFEEIRNVLKSDFSKLLNQKSFLSGCSICDFFINHSVLIVLISKFL